MFPYNLKTMLHPDLYFKLVKQFKLLGLLLKNNVQLKIEKRITSGQVALKNSYAERNFSNWYNNSYQVSDYSQAYVPNVGPLK